MKQNQKTRKLEGFENYKKRKSIDSDEFFLKDKHFKEYLEVVKEDAKNISDAKFKRQEKFDRELYLTGQSAVV